MTKLLSTMHNNAHSFGLTKENLTKDNVYVLGTLLDLAAQQKQMKTNHGLRQRIHMPIFYLSFSFLPCPLSFFSFVFSTLSCKYA